jgi:hypothetical protein
MHFLTIGSAPLVISLRTVVENTPNTPNTQLVVSSLSTTLPIKTIHSINY